MLAKVAGFVLAGSLGILAISGLTGIDDAWREREMRERVRDHVQIRVRENVRHRVREHTRHARAEYRRADREAQQELAPSDAQPESVQGTYAFDADGAVFGKFAWNANVQLDLQQDGRYEMRVKTSMNGETETETSWGRYRVVDGAVELLSAHDDDAHRLLIDGDRLTFNADFKEKLALKAVGIEDAAFTRIR